MHGNSQSPCVEAVHAHGRPLLGGDLTSYDVTLAIMQHAIIMQVFLLLAVHFLEALVLANSHGDAKSHGCK